MIETAGEDNLSGFSTTLKEVMMKNFERFVTAATAGCAKKTGIASKGWAIAAARRINMPPMIGHLSVSIW
jgi:hypothetical protein